MKTHKGFTLIELMIVIAIVAIIGATFSGGCQIEITSTSQTEKHEGEIEDRDITKSTMEQY